MTHQLRVYPDRPAFPGAEGFGAYTKGGRGGRVVRVTNLNDSGVGSFRQAVQVETGPRIVVFDVSGVIPVTSFNGKVWLNPGNSWITIAGQTSPGGVCIAGQINVCGYQVICRHLRVRPPSGKESAFRVMGPSRFHYGYDAHDLIFDHCSTSWASDQTFTISQGAYNTTVQNCIVGPCTNSAYHAYPFLISGKDTVGVGNTKATLWRNFILTGNERLPQFGAGFDVSYDLPPYVDIVNNVIYNWTSRKTMVMCGLAYANVVHNYLKAGPLSSNSSATAYLNEYHPVRLWFTANASLTPSQWDIWEPEPCLYMSGNIGCSRASQSDPEWVVGWAPAGGKNWNQAYVDRVHAGIDETAIEDYRSLTRFGYPIVTTETASESMANAIVAQCGATKVSDPDLRAAGFGHDNYDLARIADYTSGTTGSIPSSITYPSGYTDFGLHTEAAPLADSDNDGIPDIYEGTFSNVEDYLDWLCE